MTKQILTNYNTRQVFSFSKHNFGPLLKESFDFCKEAVEGGMGEIYPCRPRDPEDKHGYNLVLKTYHPHVNKEIFRKEALFMLKMKWHPNVVYAGCAYEEDGRFYLLMELVGQPPVDQSQKITGNSVHDFIMTEDKSQYMDSFAKSQDKIMQTICKNKDKDLSKLYLYWMIQACDGLQYAYKCGAPEFIAHRDLKPDNLLIAEDGTLKISDFGFSFEKGNGVGTEEYAAPELRDKENSPNVKTDIYALGIIFYQMVNGGHHPAEKTNYPGQKAQAVFPPSKKYDDIIQKCCAQNPKDRYCSLSQLRADLVEELGQKVAEPEVKEMEPELYMLKAEGFFNLADYENTVIYMNEGEKLGKKHGIQPQLENLFSRAVAYKHLGKYNEMYQDARSIQKEADMLDLIAQQTGDKFFLERSQLCQAFVQFAEGLSLLFMPENVRKELEAPDEWGVPVEKVALDNFTEAIEAGLLLDGEVFYWKGFAYRKLGYVQDALDCFNKALAMGFNEGKLYYQRAWCYLLLKQCELAVQDFNQAEKLDYIPLNFYALLQKKIFNEEILPPELNNPEKSREQIIQLARLVIHDLEKIKSDTGGSFKTFYWLVFAYHIFQEYTSSTKKERKKPNSFINRYLFFAYLFIDKEDLAKQDELAFELGKLCLRCNECQVGAKSFKRAIRQNKTYAKEIERLCDEKDVEDEKDVWYHNVFEV